MAWLLDPRWREYIKAPRTGEGRWGSNVIIVFNLPRNWWDCPRTSALLLRKMGNHCRLMSGCSSLWLVSGNKFLESLKTICPREENSLLWRNNSSNDGKAFLKEHTHTQKHISDAWAYDVASWTYTRTVSWFV